MHSSKQLTSSSFALTLDGRDASVDEIFPGFNDRDRLGIVVRRSGGALGASALILATITRFYDFQRARGGDFFIYPDYYVFHVGQPHGDHNMLDIWPDHKEVVVPDDPEDLLRAINDRAITRLLVEEAELGSHEYRRETISSCRILTALVYSPTGRTRDADVAVMGNAVTESYVTATLGKSAVISPEAGAAIRAMRQDLLQNGSVVESYRRVDLDVALSTLGPGT